MSITNSQSLLILMPIESVMPSNHLILYCPLLLTSIFPSITVFSNELALCIRWPEYWSFSFNISPSNESVQFSSVTQLSLTLCDPMDCSTPGFPVHHQLQEPTQTHVHCIGDAIQPSHPLLSPSPDFNFAATSQSISREINPEYSLEGLMLKLKLQYFGHLT